MGNSSHTVSFASAGVFSFKRLTITGWQGVYGDGSAGTAGRLFIGSSATVDREKLDQLQFVDGSGATYYTVQLASGELVPGSNVATSPTGYSNVQVTSQPTSGGSWSGSTTGPYTFTPSADNANILYTDIQNRIRGSGFTSGNVTIVTTNGTGTQVGNVNIAYPITAATNVAKTFSVIASGSINVTSAVDLGTANGNPGSNVSFTSGINISLTAALNTAATYYSTASPGWVSLTAAGKVYTSSLGTITTSCYNATAGAIGITGATGVSLGGDITATITYSGTQGDVTISDGANTVTSSGGDNDGQFSGIILCRNLIKSGTGTFVIKGSNTYNGTTTISEGTLKLGAANSIPTSSALTMNGGSFNTGGFAQTVGSLVLTDNSTMIMPSIIHTLTATAIGTFTAGKILTINGWEGTYTAPGATATKGKIIINGTALNATILSQIKFFNAADGTTHGALQLTKEVVAGN